MARKGYVTIALPVELYTTIEGFIKERRDLRYHSVVEFIKDALNCKFKEYNINTELLKYGPAMKESMLQIIEQVDKVFGPGSYVRPGPRSVGDFKLQDGTLVEIKLRRITPNNSPWFIKQVNSMLSYSEKLMIIALDFDPSIREAIQNLVEHTDIRIRLLTTSELMDMQINEKKTETESP